VSALFDSLVAAHEDLVDEAIPHALVGGLAVSLRSEPRFTRDADVALSVQGDTEAERLVRRLQGRGYRVAALIEQTTIGVLAAVRMTSRLPDGIMLDLLIASSGIEHEIVEEAEHLAVMSSLSMPVARVGHLIALKLLSVDAIRRRQDAIDLDALAEVATDEDWADADRCVRLITDRGFQRERDLSASLEALRTSQPRP
jgi:hypothetical protein